MASQVRSSQGRKDSPGRGRRRRNTGAERRDCRGVEILDKIRITRTETQTRTVFAFETVVLAYGTTVLAFATKVSALETVFAFGTAFAFETVLAFGTAFAFETTLALETAPALG